jgi:hypothetical protein
LRLHRSAFRHGIGEDAIRHARRRAVVIIDLEPEADPPKVLAIGPDRAGNLIEMVWLEMDGGEELMIHAMPMRRGFAALLPPTVEDQ